MAYHKMLYNSFSPTIIIIAVHKKKGYHKCLKVQQIDAAKGWKGSDHKNG